MRTFLIAITLLATLSTPAVAQTTGSVEMQALNKGGSSRPEFALNIYVEHQLPMKLKSWTWGLVTETWAEAYTGLAYAPTSWFEFGFAAGIEQAAQPWRIAGYVWMGNKYVSFYATAEEGGSGPWYLATLLAKPLPWLQLGAMIRRFVGVGPRIDFSLPVGPMFKLWAAYLPYEPETNLVDPLRILTGLSYNF